MSTLSKHKVIFFYDPHKAFELAHKEIARTVIHTPLVEDMRKCAKANIASQPL